MARIDRVKRALDKVHAAEREYEAAVARDLPVGTRVYWTHGRQNLSAEVIGHRGTRLRVRGHTGREYDLHSENVDTCA